MSSETKDLVPLPKFEQLAWNSYSPTAPGEARVPIETLAEAKELFERGSTNLAIKIIESHPAVEFDADAMNALGVMQLQKRNFEQARECLRRALTILDHRRAISFANMATLHIYQREWSDAKDTSRNGISVSKRTPHNWINLMFCLSKLGENEDLRKTIIDLSKAIPEWRSNAHIQKHVKQDILPALRRQPTPPIEIIGKFTNERTDHDQKIRN